MAKLIQGLLGSSAGKVGGIVTASWKGINYARGYAIPANPNTTAQQTERSLFAFIVAVAKLVLASVINTYWDPFQVGKSGFNGFMSANRGAVTAVDNYDEIIMSQGSLEGESIDAFTYATATGATSITWTPTGLGNGADTDAAVIVIVDEDNNVAFVEDAITDRQGGESTPSIGAGRTATSLHAYLFFYRGTGEDLVVSNSSYSVGSA